MGSRSGSSGSDSGFTLLEVLVVLVITSMLSLLLVDGIGQVMLLERRMELRTSEFRTRQLEQIWIRQVLASARAHNDHPFVFSTTSVSGLTLSPLAADTGIPTAFELSLVDTGLVTEIRYREGAGKVYTIVEFDNAELRNPPSFQALQNDGTYSGIWRSKEGGPQWPAGLALSLPMLEGDVVWHFAVPGRKKPPVDVTEMLGI